MKESDKLCFTGWPQPTNRHARPSGNTRVFLNDQSMVLCRDGNGVAVWNIINCFLSNFTLTITLKNGMVTLMLIKTNKQRRHAIS